MIIRLKDLDIRPGDLIIDKFYGKTVQYTVIGVYKDIRYPVVEVRWNDDGIYKSGYFSMRTELTDMRTYRSMHQDEEEIL